MISISHSPNSNTKQSILALGQLVFPWKWLSWRKGECPRSLERKFSQMHRSLDAISFSQAREGLFALLKAHGIGEGDEVIIQGFTCIVLPNAVKWAGAKPIYADINKNTLNLDKSTIEQKLSSSTKAVIVQHSMGYPAHIESIKEFCEQHNLILIEDCALALGATVNNTFVGTFGESAIFSLGRDKVLSGVSGGVVISRNPKVVEKLRESQKRAPQRPRSWVFQMLMHPIIVPIATRFMNKSKIGQIKMVISQKLGLINKVYSLNEKKTVKPTDEVHKLPNALAKLGLKQFSELKKLNAIRHEHAEAYKQFCYTNGIAHQEAYPQTKPNYLRFSLFVENRDKLLNYLKEKGFLCGDWYKTSIMPEPSQLESVSYSREDCPNAELRSRDVINLPTHRKLSKKQRERLLLHIKTFIDTYDRS